MKKSFILKKWVENILLMIQFMLILILGAESDNTIVFIGSKVIVILLFYMNHLIIERYTRFYE